jgi:glycosyltransferase involved in cell wall biosynthesis
MKIGILGTRGIPNAYGGFEQFAQYLAQGLHKKGYTVSVYNSSDHPCQEPEWNGIQLIHCKDWESRIGTAGQFIYDYNCFRDAAKRNFDVLLQLGYTSNSIWRRIWPKGVTQVINMDGLEWKRSKYSRPVRKFLRIAESWAVKHGDILIADSVGIRDYIFEKYGKSSVYIPYGAEIPSAYSPSVPGEWGLQANGYYLLMARMEPENNIEMILQGWLASRKENPLVLIGNWGNTFGKYLVKTYRHEKIRFIGAIYDQQTVNALRHYSALYFHGHSVGGTNPSLLEAMACECAIAAHDNVFNRAILAGESWYFSSADEVRNIIDGERDPGIIYQRRKKNTEKIREQYNWQRIVDDYEKVILNGSAYLKNKPVSV